MVQECQEDVLKQCSFEMGDLRADFLKLCEIEQKYAGFLLTRYRLFYGPPKELFDSMNFTSSNAYFAWEYLFRERNPLIPHCGVVRD